METDQKTIWQQHIQTLLDNFLDKMFQCIGFGVILAVKNLNSIFELSASQSNLKNVNRKPKKINNNHKWFDEECKIP